MKKWLLSLCLFAVFAFVAALFLTPSFTQRCTDDLLMCVETAKAAGFWGRLGALLLCVYHNVVCVLGGLFV